MAASVLIADDDANISQALSFLMQREGHAVRIATDGEQVLAAVEQERPDVVLLDLMMPKGNGYEICRALRANRQYDGIRIVMLSAKGGAADQRFGMDLGADAYITKPFAIADVVACLRAVLADGYERPPTGP